MVFLQQEDEERKKRDLGKLQEMHSDSLENLVRCDVIFLYSLGMPGI